jgi:hypothetical protein
VKFNLERIIFGRPQQNKELALKVGFVILTSAKSNRHTKAALLLLKACLSVAWSYFIWNTKDTIEPKRDCLQVELKQITAPTLKSCH